MAELRFERYPLVAQCPTACAWLTFLANLQRFPNTLDAYARDLQDYFAFCEAQQLALESIKQAANLPSLLIGRWGK